MRSTTGITCTLDMMRILVYEPLSAADPAATAALGRDHCAHQVMLAAGRAMRDAIVADLAALAALADVSVAVAVSEQEAGHPSMAPLPRAITPRPGESAV